MTSQRNLIETRLKHGDIFEIAIMYRHESASESQQASKLFRLYFTKAPTRLRPRVDAVYQQRLPKLAIE